MNIDSFTSRCGSQEAVVVGDSGYFLTVVCTYPDGTTRVRKCNYYATHGEEYCPLIKKNKEEI